MPTSAPHLPQIPAVPVSLISRDEQRFVLMAMLHSPLQTIIRVNLLEDSPIGVKYLQENFIREFVNCRAR
jgi:hypothetical protein